MLTPEREKEIRENVRVGFYLINDGIELLAEIDLLRSQAGQREITNQQLTKEIIEIDQKLAVTVDTLEHIAHNAAYVDDLTYCVLAEKTLTQIRGNK